jgi:hypothetical protein
MSSNRTPTSSQFENMRNAFGINEEGKVAQNNNAKPIPSSSTKSSSTKKIQSTLSPATTKASDDSQYWNEEDGIFGPLEFEDSSSSHNDTAKLTLSSIEAALLSGPISLPPTSFSLSLPSSKPKKIETRDQRSQSVPQSSQPTQDIPKRIVGFTIGLRQ